MSRGQSFAERLVQGNSQMTGLSEEAGIATAFALAAWAISDRIRRFMNRGSIYPISALSDRQLNDIGLISTDFAGPPDSRYTSMRAVSSIVSFVNGIWAEDSVCLKRPRTWKTWRSGHLSRSFAAIARCLNPPPSFSCQWNGGRGAGAVIFLARCRVR